MLFPVVVLVTGVLSGVTASIAGFGIGSLLTPLLALSVGAEAAIAAVAIPHAVASAFRSWRLRPAIDRRVLRHFGLVSAAGSLVGALLQPALGGRALTAVLGGLLLLTSIGGLTSWTSKVAWRGPWVPVLGLLSGIFGGLAGNQGGMRAAALSTLRLSPVAFVATSSAIGLLVDAARTPVYVWQAGGRLSTLTLPIVMATIGVVVGTLLGERALLRLSPERFRRIVSVLIGALGAALLFGAWSAGV